MEIFTQTGTSAPDFTLPDLEGDQHELAGYRGKIILLYFWSADCDWCKRLDGELAKDLAAWGPGVSLLTIASNANETADQIRKTAAAREIPCMLSDSSQTVADLYGAITTPQFFLIDADGILRYQGAYDDMNFRRHTPTRFYLKQAVQAVQQGRQPDPSTTPPYGCAIVRFNP